jgi:hypothetical protein
MGTDTECITFGYVCGLEPSGDVRPQPATVASVPVAATDGSMSSDGRLSRHSGGLGEASRSSAMSFANENGL